jgi:actin-related protein
MSAAASKNAIVIYNDYYHIQIGRAGEDNPSSVIPACTTRDGLDMKAGNAAYDLRQSHPLNRPYDGTVLNWDDMEALWDCGWRNYKGENVLLCDSIINTRQNQEKACEVFMESFRCRGINSQIHNVLVGYDVGRTEYTSVAIDHSHIHVICVFEGYLIEESVLTLPNVGLHLLEATLVDKYKCKYFHDLLSVICD